MPSSLSTLITQPTARVFRRLYMKRRILSTGLFEPAWQEMTGFVKRWGTTESTIDDVNLNRFTQSGIVLVMRNDTGAFNPESNTQSFWYGYLTRYRTLVKIEAGYFDEADSELPADPTQGIFLLDGEIEIGSSNNEAVLNCRALSSVFSEVRAVDVAGLGITLTSTQILQRIRDHTDGASASVFGQFIPAVDWTIPSLTTAYLLNSTGSLASMSCWDLITKLAESETRIPTITRTGGLEFRGRSEERGSFVLYGQGFPRQNVIRLDNYKEALDKYYTFFRFKFRPEDTSTSFVTAGTQTTVTPGNLSWKYGARVYEFEHDFFQTATAAQAVVDGMLAEFSTLKAELRVVAKFIPDIDIGDRVDLYYRSYDLAGATIWDGFAWDAADWDGDKGENFDWFGVQFLVLSRQTNLGDFTTTLQLRSVI